MESIRFYREGLEIEAGDWSPSIIKFHRSTLFERTHEKIIEAIFSCVPSNNFIETPLFKIFHRTFFSFQNDENHLLSLRYCF